MKVVPETATALFQPHDADGRAAATPATIAAPAARTAVTAGSALPYHQPVLMPVASER